MATSSRIFTIQLECQAFLLAKFKTYDLDMTIFGKWRSRSFQPYKNVKGSIICKLRANLRHKCRVFGFVSMISCTKFHIAIRKLLYIQQINAHLTKTTMAIDNRHTKELIYRKKSKCLIYRLQHITAISGFRQI